MGELVSRYFFLSPRSRHEGDVVILFLLVLLVFPFTFPTKITYVSSVPVVVLVSVCAAATVNWEFGEHFVYSVYISRKHPGLCVQREYVRKLHLF